MSALVQVSAKEVKRPRWWKSTTISGKPAGLGFQCPICGLGYMHDAPSEIFHCGKVEKAPILTALLPTFSLGEGSRNIPNAIFVGDWSADSEGEKR